VKVSAARRLAVTALAVAAVILTSAPASAASLRPDPVWHHLSGSQEVAWAVAALAALGAPDTRAGRVTMYLWFAAEGVPHDLNNPLNLTAPYDHSYTSTADGDPAWVHVQAYRKPADFAVAFRREMLYHGPDWIGPVHGGYYYLVAALRAGRGLAGRQPAGVRADLSAYSGGGYDSLPAW
jgi:hypothetical protein